jgi:hypothetical protein
MLHNPSNGKVTLTKRHIQIYWSPILFQGTEKAVCFIILCYASAFVVYKLLLMTKESTICQPRTVRILWEIFSNCNYILVHRRSAQKKRIRQGIIHCNRECGTKSSMERSYSKFGSYNVLVLLCIEKLNERKTGNIYSAFKVPLAWAIKVTAFYILLSWSCVRIPAEAWISVCTRSTYA